MISFALAFPSFKILLYFCAVSPAMAFNKIFTKEESTPKEQNAQNNLSWFHIKLYIFDRFQQDKQSYIYIAEQIIEKYCIYELFAKKRINKV